MSKPDETTAVILERMEKQAQATLAECESWGTDDCKACDGTGDIYRGTTVEGPCHYCDGTGGVTPTTTAAAAQHLADIQEITKRLGKARRLAEWEGFYVGRDAVVDRVELGLKFLDILDPTWREAPERLAQGGGES